MLFYLLTNWLDLTILDVADGKTANRQFEGLPVADSNGKTAIDSNGGNVHGHFRPKMTQIGAKSGQIPSKMRQKCKKNL